MISIYEIARQSKKTQEEIIVLLKQLNISYCKETKQLFLKDAQCFYEYLKQNTGHNKASNDSAISKKFDLEENLKDRIFERDIATKFEFNGLVASVFDDMIERSVPFYDEVIDIAIFFIVQFLQNRDGHTSAPIVYDLGSSTGNLLLRLDDALRKQSVTADLYGIDSSLAMIERSRLKTLAMGAKIEFLHEDFLRMSFQQADIFLAFYTMQFIRPLQRPSLVQKIYDSLNWHGIFLFAEKVISQDSTLEVQMISCYHDYKKKQGYSQTEIYKKREALENILVPYSVEENCNMLYSCGFKHVEILFKWVNFTLFLAKK